MYEAIIITKILMQVSPATNHKTVEIRLCAKTSLPNGMNETMYYLNNQTRII